MLCFLIFGKLLKLHTVFLLGIYDHEPCGLPRIYINIFYITWWSYFTDSNSISHYTFTHLSSNQSCTFIFIFLLKTHSVTLNCPTSMKTILHNIKRWNHIVSSKLTILAVISMHKIATYVILIFFKWKTNLLYIYLKLTRKFSQKISK